MINLNLNEEEAFLIFSLRKGYAECEHVIFSLAGKPWTDEELKRYLACRNELEHKQMEIDQYIKVCSLAGKPVDISHINKISQRYDQEIKERQKQTRDRYTILQDRYNEFLNFYKVRNIK